MRKTFLFPFFSVSPGWGAFTERLPVLENTIEVIVASFYDNVTSTIDNLILNM
jgi:hypothetical protein